MKYCDFAVEMDKEDFNKLLGKHIKEIRERKNLSQSDLASSMGINFQNISSYERGEVSPTLFWINRLCESMEVDCEIFISEFLHKIK